MPNPGDMPKRLPSLPVIEVAPLLSFHGEYYGKVKMRSTDQMHQTIVMPIETFANFLDDVRAGVYDHLLELPMPKVS